MVQNVDIQDALKKKKPIATADDPSCQPSEEEDLTWQPPKAAQYNDPRL